MDSLRERYLRIKALIPSNVTFLAVSKGQTADSVRELYELGHRDFGENYVQELIGKARELESNGCAGIRWHFIGHLQTNKVKTLLPFVHSIHSIDSIKLAREISARADQITPRKESIPCFLEINIDQEESKSGFSPTEVAKAAQEIAKLPHIDLRGLMCIPAPSDDVASVRNSFTKLRTLEISCRPATKNELSMGMSHDFELAISEGSSVVRIGTAVFGPRKNHSKSNN